MKIEIKIIASHQTPAAAIQDYLYRVERIQLTSRILKKTVNINGTRMFLYYLEGEQIL